MKLHSRHKTMVVLTFVFLVVNACTEDFEELNTNPALVTKEVVKPDLLFTNVIKKSVFSLVGTGTINEYSGYGSNQASGVILQNRDWGNPFTTFYGDYIINISEVVRLTADDPLEINKHAIARIWKVWLFHQLTDAYGDIPYSEAALSFEDAVNQPKYDSQEMIYKDMLNELKEAAGQLSSDPELLSFGPADLIYEGDADAWIRFANSLRLRLAMRVRNVDPALASQHVNEVITAPLITVNDEMPTLTSLEEDAIDRNNRNPIFNAFDSGTGNEVSVSGFTIIENMNMRNDPRLPVYAQPAEDGVSGFRGRPIALLGAAEKEPYGNESISRMGSLFLQSAYTFTVITAAEINFWRAEAALFGLTSEDAESFYRAGIEVSMDQYNVDQADKDTYLASAEGSLTGTDEEKLEQIIIQKFIANIFHPAEAWAEYRRTGYPLIWTGGDVGDTGGQIPRRLTYPLDEYAKNEISVTTATGRLDKGDNLLSKVWWDVKPELPFQHPKQGTFPPD